MIRAILKLKERSFYRLYKAKDNNILILTDFLSSDIGSSKSSIERIFSWLESERIEYGTNLTDLEKEDEIIILTSDIPSRMGDYLEIKKKNFVEILKKWENIFLKKPKEVALKQGSDGTIFLEGNDNVVPDALIKFYDGKYRQSGYNDVSLENLILFLTHEFESKDISHKFIFDEWLKDPKEISLEDDFLLLEKEGDIVSVFYQFGGAKRKDTFKATKKQLCEIYKNLQELKMLNPKVIRVYIDSNKIKLEGLDNEI